MRRRLRLRASIVMGIAACAGTVSGQEIARPAFAVLAYDYASVPPATVGRARDKATRIYREAGVDLMWIDPVADPGNPIITQSPEAPALFAVRMLIRPKRRPSHWTPEWVMGYALSTDRGGTVSLFYDQVQATAASYHQPVADVLGLTIAHEIGHVLLGYPSHSETGVMRPTWDGDDLRHAIVGTLRFTPAQAALIRDKVARCCGC